MMRRATPTIPLLTLAAAAALASPAGAAKECTTKGCTVKAGVYDGPLVLYVGSAPPYSNKGQVALLRGQTGKNPVKGTCVENGSRKSYTPVVEGTGAYVMKGKAPKIGKTKTYKGSSRRSGEGYTESIATTLNVKFLSAKRARLTLSVTDKFKTATCTGKATWTVKR